jgi:hypothetical protein
MPAYGKRVHQKVSSTGSTGADTTLQNTRYDNKEKAAGYDHIPPPSTL